MKPWNGTRWTKTSQEKVISHTHLPISMSRLTTTTQAKVISYLEVLDCQWWTTVFNTHSCQYSKFKVLIPPRTEVNAPSKKNQSVRKQTQIVTITRAVTPVTSHRTSVRFSVANCRLMTRRTGPINRLNASSLRRTLLSEEHWSASINSCARIQDLKTTRSTWSEVPLYTDFSSLSPLYSQVTSGSGSQRRAWWSHQVRSSTLRDLQVPKSRIKWLNSAPNWRKGSIRAVSAFLIKQATILFNFSMMLSTRDRESYRWGEEMGSSVEYPFLYDRSRVRSNTCRGSTSSTRNWSSVKEPPSRWVLIWTASQKRRVREAINQSKDSQAVYSKTRNRARCSCLTCKDESNLDLWSTEGASHLQVWVTAMNKKRRRKSQTGVHRVTSSSAREEAIESFRG